MSLVGYLPSHIQRALVRGIIVNYSGILFSFSTRFMIRRSSVRESKTVLDSGFQIMGSGFLVSGTESPDSSR